MFKKLLLFVSVAVLFVSCKDKNPTGTLAIGLKAMYDDTELTIGEEFITSDGTAFELSNFYLYLSDVLIENGEDESLLVDSIILLDLLDENLLTYQVEADEGNYTLSRFGLGVKPSANHVNPADMPADHPLGWSQIGNNWTWDSGFIFYKIDGKFDLNADGEAEEIFSYHIGSDNFFNTLNFNRSIQIVDDQVTDLILEVDFRKLFYPTAAEIQAGYQTFDFNTELFSHSTGSGEAIAEKIINNMLLTIE